MNDLKFTTAGDYMKMKERIEELACQANLKLDDLPDNILIPLENFAELIVKECIEQINKVEEKGDAHLGGGYFYDGTRLCRDAIKQHFGVDE